VVSGPAAGCAAVILAGGQARRLGGADKPGLEVAGRTMLAAVADAAAQAGAAPVIVVGPARTGLPTARFVREDPPGGGPVPALRRGLSEVTEPWLLLLAADLPFLSARLLTQLRTASAGAVDQGAVGHRAADREATDPAAADHGTTDHGVTDYGATGPGGAEHRATEHEAADQAAVSQGAAQPRGAVLADGDGRPQWLTSCWPTGPLRAALAGYPGRSLRGLLDPLDPVLVRYQPDPGQAPPWFDCDTPAELAQAQSWAGRGGR
jgi:molybdopterin-guanine dinucleotide biosynthesis protein A